MACQEMQVQLLCRLLFSVEALGIGILMSGLFGTVNGSSVSVENAGLLALTSVGSRRVVQISAGFMIFFSILGKFGAVFASIPAPICCCFILPFLCLRWFGRFKFPSALQSQQKFILGFSVFLGLSISQYFNENTAINGYGPVHSSERWFNDMINVPFSLSSETFVAGLLAYFVIA